MLPERTDFKDKAVSLVRKLAGARQTTLKSGELFDSTA